MSLLLQASNVTLSQLQEKTGLSWQHDRGFFAEWQAAMPELTAWEKETCDRIRLGYFDLIQRDHPSEAAVRSSIVHPLLFAAGFNLAPMTLLPEYSVQTRLEDTDETIIEGRMDALILHERLWVLVVESKRSGLSVEGAIGQLLSYLLGSPTRDRPVYGLITNGGEFLFVKCDRLAAQPRYGLSDLFTLLRQENELYRVLGILKHLSQSLEDH